MPLLAYCIVEAEAVALIRDLGIGLDGVPMKNVEHNGLRLFVSESHEISSLPGEIRENALAFHRVLDGIFQHAAIIPFRFPTMFPSQVEATEHMAEHSVEYTSALTRLRDMVQMEIRIRSNNPKPGVSTATASGTTHGKQSGTEYLRKIQARHARLGAASRDFQNVCKDLTAEWKQRDSDDGVRCFALISRTAIEEFRERVAAVIPESGFAFRVSGPWPATQFLKEE